MATALEVFALDNNLESSDPGAKKQSERKGLIKDFFSEKIRAKNPAIIFSQEVFSKTLINLVKEGLGLGIDTYDHVQAQDGKKHTVIMVNKDVFQELKRLNETVRRQVLEKRRRSDVNFLKEDARVLVCTAVVMSYNEAKNKDEQKIILLVCYHAPHIGLKGNVKEENFKQFLTFVMDIKDKLKCEYLICGVDSNLTSNGADGFAADFPEFLKGLKMKIVAGNRPNKQNIDCFILSENFVVSTENVETFDVDKTVLDHNPIGVTLIFKEIKIKAKQPRLKVKKVERKVTEKGDDTKTEKKENVRRRKPKEDEVPMRRAQAN